MDEPSFDENATFLQAELDAYRDAMIESRNRDRVELQKLGDTDFTHFDARTADFGMMDYDVLFDKMINNFWARLPGGFYKDQFEKSLRQHSIPVDRAQRDIESLHQLENVINENGLNVDAQRIVAKDSMLDSDEKRKILKKLYCEMRKAGYSRQELTS